MKKAVWFLGLAVATGAEFAAAQGPCLEWTDEFEGLFTDGFLAAVTEWDDGSGSALFGVGAFSEMRGVSARDVVRYDGTSWSPLGSGIFGVLKTVATWDDGSGSALYVGGSFVVAGGVRAQNVAVPRPRVGSGAVAVFAARRRDQNQRDNGRCHP